MENTSTVVVYFMSFVKALKVAAVVSVAKKRILIKAIVDFGLRMRSICSQRICPEIITTMNLSLFIRKLDICSLLRLKFSSRNYIFPPNWSNFNVFFDVFVLHFSFSKKVSIILDCKVYKSEFISKTFKDTNRQISKRQFKWQTDGEENLRMSDKWLNGALYVLVCRIYWIMYNVINWYAGATVRLRYWWTDIAHIVRIPDREIQLNRIVLSGRNHLTSIRGGQTIEKHYSSIHLYIYIYFIYTQRYALV